MDPLCSQWYGWYPRLSGWVVKFWILGYHKRPKIKVKLLILIAVEILNNYKSVSEFYGAEKCKGVLFEKYQISFVVFGLWSLIKWEVFRLH